MGKGKMFKNEHLDYIKLPINQFDIKIISSEILKFNINNEKCRMEKIKY